MATLLKAGTLVEFEPASVEVADLRIDRGTIVARGPSLTPEPTDEVIDVAGKLVLPGLVSAHHRLHSTAFRGLKREPGFRGASAAIERLEQTLTHDDLQALAAAGGLEGLEAGVTTLFNVHRAPTATLGSSTAVAHGLSGVGLRAVLGCEVSDRAGAVVREEALEENEQFAQRARGRLRGGWGLGGLDSLTDDALRGVQQAFALKGRMLLVTLGETRSEAAMSTERFGHAPLDRLATAGLIGPSTVFAHNVHLSWPELSQVISTGSWMVHVARANMALQAGQATPAKFGVRTCLGTDSQSLDVLAEVQLATLRSLDVEQPLDPLRLLANGHRLASEAFGATIGPLREGALADLVVFDYQPPTPLTDATLAAHVLALSTRHVESVMVDGLWRLWNRKPLAVDVLEVGRVARDATRAAWARLG